MPAFQRRGGGAQHHLAWLAVAAEQLGAVDGQVSGGVAGTVLALVAGVVFFVHHDQAQTWQAGQHTQPGAQYDADSPGVGRQPAFQALRGSHAAVHGHHLRLPKPFGEALLKLGGEVDFRHHHQRLCVSVLRQCALHRMHVDLGFTAACGAEEQHWPLCQSQCVQSCLLFRTQLWQRSCGYVRVLGCPGPGRHDLGALLEQALQLCGLKITQLRR